MTLSAPNQFHFIFGMKPQPQPLHLIHYLCIESCFQVNRPEKIYFYCYREPFGRYWDLIKDRVVRVPVEPVPEILEFDYRDKLIRKKLTYAHHSDFIRLDKLNEHGGVYADLDTIFVNPLPSQLFEKPFVMGEEPAVFSQAHNDFRPSLCNALMIAPKASAFGKRYRQEMAAALDGSWSNHSCGLAHELSEKFPGEIHCEPARSFYKHTWSKEGLETLLRGCDRDFSGVYSMHLWAHLWWSRWRRDFTSFHAGMVTEGYIRSVDTTYTIVARQFLPPPEKPRRFWSMFQRATRGLRQVAPD